MNDQEHAEPVLKVIDRRHFTTEGERRTEVAEDVAVPPPPTPAAPPQAAAPAAAAPPEPQAGSKTPAPAFERLATREITFGSLIEEFYATALMQLGAMAPPGQAPRIDLEGARETIDLLGLMQQKTHGNLTQQEDRLLNQALYELRIGYTEVSRAANSRIAVPNVANVANVKAPPRR